MAAAVTIERVDTYLVDLPTIRPHQLAMTTMKRQTLMIVRLDLSDGTVGWGEGTTIGGLAYGAESPEGMKLAIDTYFKPILLQADPVRVGETMAGIGQAIQGNHFAKCAVETALMDALGKHRGIAVSECLGGRRHDRLPVAWTLARATRAGTSRKPRKCLRGVATTFSRSRSDAVIPPRTLRMLRPSSGPCPTAPAFASTSIRPGATRAPRFS
jgi:L-alanine-DL-glutamate epimerase-like enolase superfamily enzyme